jgi:hypothetical protein
MITATHHKVLRTLRTCRTDSQRDVAVRFAELWIDRLQQTFSELERDKIGASDMIRQVKKEVVI